MCMRRARAARWGDDLTGDLAPGLTAAARDKKIQARQLSVAKHAANQAIRKAVNTKIEACAITPEMKAEMNERYESVRAPKGVVRQNMDLFGGRSKFKSADWLSITEHLATFLFTEILPNNPDANKAIVSMLMCVKELVSREITTT